MKVLILRHVLIEHAGVFENVFKSKNIDFVYIDPEDELVKDDYDMLMVLGGYMGVYEAKDYPFLNREFKIIEYFLKSDKPIIGICLGAQMLAHVLGSSVYKGSKGKEIGWCNIKKVDEHQFFDGFPDNFKVFQWHQDTFDIPKSSKLIYNSDKYPQAFVYKKAIGLQFHIELTSEMIKEWANVYKEDLQKEGLDEKALFDGGCITTTNNLAYKLIENIL